MHGKLPTVLGLSLCLGIRPALPAPPATQLPVPCVAGNCGLNGPTSWVKSGSATAASSGNTLNINQTSNQAILNWASFDVGAQAHVNFQQPSASSIALNNIYQQSPSNIFGQLQANGQIYLVNPNGIVFGSSARVNAAGILASTLKISDDNFAAGILSPGILTKGQAALVADGKDFNGQPLLGLDGNPLKVNLVVEEGAQIETNGVGGRAMLAAQNVQNAGTIEANGGQVVLAAGTKAYLTASDDLALRGILVEVDGGGTAWNQLSGQLSTPNGAVTMVGLAVNQDGRISATTSVSANGSVHLVAADTALVTQDTNGGTVLSAAHGGQLTLGSQSHIDVNPDLTDTHTAVVEQAQLPSTVELSGGQVYLRSGASVVAHGGDISVSTLRPVTPPPPGQENYDPTAKIHVESGVTLDASGSDVTLPMSSNFVELQLRSNELANFPVQRNGALRGQTVVVDARATGTRADGSTWVGTPVADVSATVNAVPQNVAQRTSAGGKVVFDSTGDLTVASGAKIDVSGGVVTYTGGVDESSQLITSSNRLVDIANAQPDQIYAGVLQPNAQYTHDRWGVISSTPSSYTPAYINGYQQGQSAGTVQFAAPQMLLSPTLVGSVVIGAYQRTPATAPAGGTLIIGSPTGQGYTSPDYQAPSVVFTASNAPFAVTDDAALPRGLPLSLATDYLKNGFTSTQIYSNGEVALPENLDLSLSPGSALSITARSIDVESDITAPGGKLSFSSVVTPPGAGQPSTAGVTVGPDVTLDVRGTWTNDLLTIMSGDVATGLVTKDGGSISINVAPIVSALTIGDHARFLVSGGAWLQTNRKVADGQGGSISVSATPTATLSFGSDIGVEGYGVGTTAGGTLTFAVSQLEVDEDAQWLQPFQSDASSSEAQVVHVGSGLFSDYGFSTFLLTANGLRSEDGMPDVFTVAAGTHINALSSTLLLSSDYTARPSAANVSAFSTSTLLPQYQRPKASITFKAIPAALAGDAHLATGRMNVEQDANITVDPGASITLSSVGGIDLAGELHAPGGAINLNVAVPPPTFDLGYRSDLAITLEAGSVVDVSGLRVLSPTNAYPLAGTVLNGGTVSLLADRGVLEVAEGARIEAAGGVGLVDQLLPGGNGYVREDLGSAGGTINLLAAEGISFAGTINAAAGVGQTGVTPQGGSLSVSSTRRFASIPDTVLSTFPTTTPRSAYVFDSAIAPVVSQGGGSGLSNGLALLDSELLRSSGIDFLKVSADDSVKFDAGVQLSLARAIVLNSPELTVLGRGTVALDAPYASIGNTGQGGLSPNAPGTPTTGAGQLAVSAQRLDLIGSVTVQDVGAVTLTSSADIQLVGYDFNGNAGTGSFAVAGDLTLTANRVFPSTASTFTLQAGVGDADANTATLRINQAGGASIGTPLSAAANLTLSAGYIEQNGSLLAPFGTISLDASQALTLGDNSVTSVSGEGLLIPYGNVINGTTWQYGTSGTQITGVPARQISLSAPTISTAASSRIDVSGGGDLYASEFTPGAGGTVDALKVSSGLYAIVPSLRGQYAPYDIQSYGTSNLQPGASIYLSGSPGLPAGVYPLLPASYALLPGAFLVSAVPNTTGLSPSSGLTLPDGTPIVAGYRTFDGTGLGDAQYSGFAVRPGSYAHNLASYTDHVASTFFADQATRQGLPQPALPADAGRLSISVGTSLNILGSVDTAAASGGLRGQVELAAPVLQIVGSGTASDDPGAVVIADSVLNGWNPASLLLGGQQSADGKGITVISSSVDVSGGAKLVATEVVAVAGQSIQVDSGSQLASTSGAGGAVPPAANFATPVAVTLEGAAGSGAAVLALSDLRQLTIADPSATSGANLHVDSSSSVASQGSILMSAPGGADVTGDVRGDGAYWNLSGSQVVFGSNGTQSSAFAFSPTLLDSAQRASSLTITSAGTIDFAAPTAIALSGTASTLTLAAAGLRDLEPGAAISLQAARVNLAGASGAVPTSDGTGSLAITAQTIGVGAGALGLSGFAQTHLGASADVVVSGTSELDVPGDLLVNANRINVAGGAQADWQVEGQFTLAGASTGGGQSSALQPGGALSVSAQAVQISGQIVAPSGLIQISSAGDLAVASGAKLDTSGVTVSAAGRSLGTPGGDIQLSATGSVSLADGASLAVDGVQNAAGSIAITAGQHANVDSALSGQAGAGQPGGSFELTSGTLGDFAALVAELQKGSFTASQNIHVTDGDLLLPQAVAVNAQTVNWSTDTGSIEVAGSIRATSGAQRSLVRLSAGNELIVDATARIDAGADGTSQAGGTIELSTSGQDVRVLSGAVLSAAGSSNGNLIVRAPALASDIAVSQLSGDFSGIGSIILEPLFSQSIPDGSTIDSALSSLQGQASSFVTQNEAAIKARFSALSTPLAIQPAVQILSQGDVTLGSLDLTQWRFGTDSQPVDLTIRSAGSINVTGVISDGFQQVPIGPRTYLDLLSGQSASITLTAGANLSAADPLSTAQSAADLSLASGAVVRTGTGDISLASARDILFSSDASVYTAGTAGAPTVVAQTSPSLVVLSFPTNGGSIRVSADRDVVGSPVQQNIATWEPRLGSANTPTQWGVNVQSFAWTLGSFGGGDLQVQAGRDISNVAAASADTQGVTADGQLTKFNGGSLALSAGRDVNSPFAYVADGEGALTAGRAIGSARQDNVGDSVGALLAIGDANVRLTARTDILLESAFNPQVMPQVGQPRQPSYFYTYGPDSALSVESVAGTLTLEADMTRINAFLDNPITLATPATTLPSSLTLHSLSGDVALAGAAVLFPSDTGQLDVFAARDILGSNTSASLIMSDAPDSALPTTLAPQKQGPDISVIGAAGASGRHALDPTPAYITAGRDIQGPITFGLAKQADVSAGRDIVDLGYFGQNLNAGDLTETDAGRDLLFTGAGSTSQIQLGGPGRLDVIAGRQIDLGFSSGITTVGRTVNPTLPSQGADLTLIAGLAQDLDATNFVNDIIAKYPEYQTLLDDYVAQQTGTKPSSYAQASSEFLAFTPAQQRPLLLNVFFDDLKTTGRDANASASAGFGRGYDAINALFPGSGAGETGQPPSPYLGDISLAFSRIYTVAGGNISILTPGGLVDVGLAFPPTNANPKLPSQLGIVAQGSGDVDIFSQNDVRVNASRVFTLGGGNILIWSTLGNIDAGRGAKSAVSAPPPVVTLDPVTGVVTVSFTGAVAGSGIRTIISGDDIAPGDVDLIAPVGFVNAGDAGIGSSGNLNIAAKQVVGVDNIQVGGTATGVPPPTSGIAATLSSASSAANSATTASSAVSSEESANKDVASASQAAMSWLDVFLVGLGEDNCSPEDQQCLERQKSSTK